LAGDSRVITHAEFLRAINNGWVRPDTNYHTLSVDQIAACAGGPGAVEMPGFGDPNRLWSNQCGDNLNYCRRAIMCVQR
jgi:hypothetical protein